MISGRKYKIYKKWFKLGFERQKQNGFNPNSYHNVDTSYRLEYPYKCTFKERLPWNVYWTYSGYLDGYNVANPFDCHETIYNIDIRKIWDARLEHKKITKAEYYIYRPHEELIPKLQVLDDMYADMGIVSMSARDYYYEHYANESERKRMDREDKIQTIIAAIIVGGTLLLGIGAIAMQINNCIMEG